MVSGVTGSQLIELIRLILEAKFEEDPLFGSRYSRMDQVKFVGDCL